MATKNVNVVLAHGAWADGSSWARVIAALKSESVNVVATPLPLTSLADDVAALDRSLARVEGPVVLVGHGEQAVAGCRDAGRHHEYCVHRRRAARAPARRSSPSRSRRARSRVREPECDDRRWT